MSLWKVAWRSIQQRSLVSLLTVLSMGLGVALVVAVLVVYGVVYQSFNRGGEGYDLIVGAKGGKEQLVLNTVFYLMEPVGNVPYSFYEELTEGKYNRGPLNGAVEAAIPVCMGHTYQGFRVVGTVPEMFSKLKYRGEQSYQFAKGENFKDEDHFGGVLGSVAAGRTLLQLGDTFQAVHGGEVHKDLFHVVGVLAPTGTPIDHAVFVNMRGFQEIHHPGGKSTAEDADHDHEHEKNEVTAVLVCVRKEAADRGKTDFLVRAINESPVAQAVAPVRVIHDLFEGIVGKLQWVLMGMAVLTVVVAGIGIMVSIYNSMSDRRHEIAVMRALGASRTIVMLIILMESILLSLMGGAMGLLLAHGAIWLCSPLIADWTGVVVGLMQFQLGEGWLIVGLIVLASAVGYLPALAAYRTDVAKSLITTP
jgi:putative ABC transport system permease protein